MKLKAKFPHYYLVSFNADRTATFRVTERNGHTKPKEVGFFGNNMSDESGQTYGTLVIDEVLWNKWYAGCTFLKGMETAEAAAQTLTQVSGIYYGCPVCAYHTKKYDDSAKHIVEHVNRFIDQFEFEVEEVNDNATSEK